MMRCVGRLHTGPFMQLTMIIRYVQNSLQHPGSSDVRGTPVEMSVDTKPIEGSGCVGNTSCDRGPEGTKSYGFAFRKDKFVAR